MSFATLFQTPTFLNRLASIASYLLSHYGTEAVSSVDHHLDTVTPLRLSDFDIDETTGFLPATALSRLPGDFDLWEDALSVANQKDSVLSLGEDLSLEAVAKRDSNAKWRENLCGAPVLSTDSLHADVRMLRRAHHVLAFLVHFYVHSSPPSTNQSPIHVPASLAIPLVEVSRVLGIAPVLTFADTILWNYTLLDQSKPLSSENMTFQTLFTGTSDEIGFYHCCASIELRGVEALRIISSFQSMSNVHDEKSIAQTSDALSQLAKVIDELTSILQTVRCFCEPKVFYNAIRPWFRGSDAHGPGSPGWIFDGVEDSSKLELSGPSAGQSSMIHSLDVFLDVDHQMIKPRRKEPSEANKRADHTFMKRMQRYMPSIHQKFLHELSNSPRSVRDLAERTPSLVAPYDSCVMALKRFRDAHMRVACLYVVSMSRAVPKAGCPVSAMWEQMQAEGAVCPVSQKKAPVRGTGGNELSVLLKSCRDATTRTLIGDSA